MAGVSADDPLRPSVREAAAAVREERLSARALAEGCLDRAEARELEVLAWAHLDRAAALAEAAARDDGGEGLLQGLPVGVKDIVATADMPTERGSPIHESARPFADAACVAAQEAVDAALAPGDVLMTVSAPGEAPEGLESTGDPIFCRIWTLLGLPALSLPWGAGFLGLPLGLPLIGRRRRDPELTAAAGSVEARRRDA
jgi:Asp-tRNA(Asn)/Glu-tRNA(Gln) amidotransferase A subunit family amidase